MVAKVEENRWPRVEDLQAYIAWLKTVPEEQLRIWVVDAFCKGEITVNAELVRCFMAQNEYGIDMIPKPVAGKR